MTHLWPGRPSVQRRLYDLMSRTAARFTQADVARSIRAAKQAGASAIELLPDGTIRINLISTTDKADVQPEPEQEVVL